MKELSIKRMEQLKAGMSCGAAVGLAVLSASAIGAATILAPGIWANPKTWLAASNLVAGNMYNYNSSCIK